MQMVGIKKPSKILALMQEMYKNVPHTIHNFLLSE
jgi:hypothetical protein